MPIGNEKFCFECTEENMEYFCLRKVEYGAVLNFQCVTIALKHNLLRHLLEDFSLLAKGEHAQIFTSEISSDHWLIEFNADRLEFLMYEWYGYPTRVRLFGARQILGRVCQCFHQPRSFKGD